MLKYEVKSYISVIKQLSNKSECKSSKSFSCSKENTFNIFNQDSSKFSFKKEKNLFTFNNSISHDSLNSSQIDYLASLPGEKLLQEKHSGVPVYQDPENSYVFYIIENSKSI